jgi:formate C-acetyltransferase
MANGAPTTVHPDWRLTLAACRQKRLGGRCDLRKYWRVQAYHEHAGEPEPLIRAQAFASVLRHIGLAVHPGEALAGSRAEFVLDQLPSGITETDFMAAVAEHDQRGQRTFQAGFDHATPDYPTLLAEGVDGVARRVRESRERHPLPEEQALLDAMLVCLEGLSSLAERCAAVSPAPVDLHRLAHLPPRTFHEAMQLVWLVHLAFISEGRYAMALGRIDQYLYPFYQADVQAGRIDSAGALDLFCHLWTKIEEAGEITNICIGGLTPEGEDATNELSLLAIEATRLVQSPRTNLSARFHDRSPEHYHRACFECLRTGIGFHALFNDEILVPGLVGIGIPLETARDYSLVGCIETAFAGRQQAWGDGVPGFKGESNQQCLDRALRAEAQNPTPSYEGLVERFRNEIRDFFRLCADRVNSYIARFPPERFPDPFLSLLTQDCIGRARDINDGGALIPRMYKCAGGENLASLADSLAAVKKLVFEEQRLALSELVAILDADFVGYDAIRSLFQIRAPKYGNDDPYVDQIAAEMLDLITDEVMALPPVHGGGRFVACAAGNIHNIVRGRVLGATPDGRRAGEPLSDATSPFFGRDRKGPTAILNSMARTACGRVLGGRVANLKFEPEYFDGEEGARRFSAFTHFFVEHRIQELQINFTGNRLLREAKRHPEHHRHLVVRVSGFSAYFTQLAPDVQDDVIRRRAHV